MKFEIVYSDNANKYLENLDSGTAKRIIKKIYDYSITKNPLAFAKPLKNSSLGHFRFRIGNYRAIFDVDNKCNIKILLILKIAHRKDIYRD